MPFPKRNPYRVALMGTALVVLSACESGFDLDMRRFSDGFSTSGAAQSQATARPQPDARGILSYPTYQVAIANKGDTVAEVAARVGLPAAELARYNGVPLGAQLRAGEVIALPRRVTESASGVIQPSDNIDITTLAGNAIDRAGPQSAQPGQTSLSGTEPTRHQVVRGETAYSIARLYGVSVRSLADWNGLGTELNIREGQYLLIPVVGEKTAALVPISAPGQGSQTPTPPSSITPLPQESVQTVSAPTSPDLSSGRTAASSAAMLLPVDGKIIRAFKKGSTDGIDVAASAGSPVKAASNGTVAAITRDTDQVPILVIRHPDNILTVYANIDGIVVKKGDSVKRGQKIAVVRTGKPAFLHFQVREGTASVDPQGYLN